MYICLQPPNVSGENYPGLLNGEGEHPRKFLGLPVVTSTHAGPKTCMLKSRHQKSCNLWARSSRFRQKTHGKGWGGRGGRGPLGPPKIGDFRPDF